MAQIVQIAIFWILVGSRAQEAMAYAHVPLGSPKTIGVVDIDILRPVGTLWANHLGNSVLKSPWTCTMKRRNGSVEIRAEAAVPDFSYVRSESTGV